MKLVVFAGLLVSATALQPVVQARLAPRHQADVRMALGTVPQGRGLGSVASSLIGRFRKKRQVKAEPQVEIGQVLPQVDIQVLPPLALTTEYEDTDDILPRAKTCTIVEALGQEKSLLIGMPGAFTPTCSDEHLPGYMRYASKLEEIGIKKIAVVTTNDHFTNAAWRQSLIECAGRGAAAWAPNMDLISDGDGELIKALGLAEDFGFGMGAGLRSKRFALLCEGGAVTHVAVDDGMHLLDTTSAEKFVEMLRPANSGPVVLDEEQAQIAGAVFGVLALGGLAAYYYGGL